MTEEDTTWSTKEARKVMRHCKVGKKRGKLEMKDVRRIWGP